jgi:predicted enzyme related to lactoylglutathione lyase
MGRVVHFEIHADDCERAERFYTDVFGWKVQRLDGASIDYRLVSTGPTDVPGIDGAITERRGPAPQEGAPVSSYVCTIAVEDLDAIEARVPEAGGEQVVDRREIPGVGQLSYFKDTEGNILGALQPAPHGEEPQGSEAEVGSAGG